MINEKNFKKELTEEMTKKYPKMSEKDSFTYKISLLMTDIVVAAIKKYDRENSDKA